MGGLCHNNILMGLHHDGSTECHRAYPARVRLPPIPNAFGIGIKPATQFIEKTFFFQ